MFNVPTGDIDNDNDNRNINLMDVNVRNERAINEIRYQPLRIYLHYDNYSINK